MVNVHKPGEGQLRYVVAEMTGGGFTAFLEVAHLSGEMTFIRTTAEDAQNAVIQYCEQHGMPPPVCVPSFSESTKITDEYRTFLGRKFRKEYRECVIQMNVTEELGYFRPNARYSVHVPPSSNSWVKVDMPTDGSVDPKVALINGYEFTKAAIDRHLAK